MQIYYDAESDYLEIRFGKPAESHYDKIGEDLFVRIDEKTGEETGYAIFNARKGSSLKTIEVDIPFTLLKKIKSEISN